MKLDLVETPVEKSAAFKETQFGIGNLAVILEILRSKMYSDPIKTLTQEIMCNARDAHREVGKADLPIKVSLPSIIDSHIRFRDFGPGITPDRMVGVFLLYGSSTKRDSNEQTGGFGLGAKSPFAYTDSFTVVSNTPDEAGQMWRREYVAYIDQTRIGVMNLVKEEVTTDEQGTTIIVPVKGNDFNAFSEAVRNTGKFWDVKPYVADGWDWQEPKYTFQGNGWSLLDETPGRTTVAVVDGIQYPLDISRIVDRYTTGFTYGSPHDERKEWRIANHGAALFFKVGELQITANRESLDLTPDHIKLIKDRLGEAYDELKKYIDNNLDKANNLFEAIDLYKRFKEFGVKVEWKGKLVRDEPLRFGSGSTKLARYKRGAVSSDAPYGFTRRKVDRWHQSDYYWVKLSEVLDKKKLIIECDEYSINRLVGIFRGNPDIDEVILITFKTPKAREAYCADAYWDDFNFTKLNSYEKIKLTCLTPNTAGVKISGVKVFDPDEEGYPWVPTDQDLPNGEGCYVILDHRHPMFLGKQVGTREIAALWDRIKKVDDAIDIYGIMATRASKIGPGWKPLEEYVRELIANIEANPDYSTLVDDIYELPELYFGSYINTMLAAIIKDLPNDNHLVRWCRAGKPNQKAIDLNQKMATLKGSLNEPAPVIKPANKWVESINDKFPLLIPMLKGLNASQPTNYKKVIVPQILAYLKSCEPQPVVATVSVIDTIPADVSEVLGV